MIRFVSHLQSKEKTMMDRQKWMVGIILTVITLFVTGCVGANPPTADTAAAPAAESTTAPAQEAAASAEPWYNPDDLGEPWYNICEDTPPQQGGEITSNQAAEALAGGANWFSYAAKDQYLWNQLFDQDVDGETIHPDLATDWTASDDGLVYTFNLRNDVKFHDGAPLTANDVKWTVEAFLHPESAIPFGRTLSLDAIKGAEEFIAGSAEEVEGVKVVDDFTVEITLAHPQSNFLDKVRGLNIHPKHILEGIAYKDLLTSEYAKTKPIGTGPFKLGEYVPEQYYILEANEEYYAGRPYLDRIIMRIGLRGATAIAALEADEIQVAGTVTPDDYIRLKDNPAIAMVGGALGGGLSVFPNLTKAPFDDLRVREAFMYALDREAIVDAYYNGGELAQVLHSNLTGPLASPNIKKFEYDPEKAKALLAEAGWDPDYEVQFLSYYQSDFDKRVQAAMQQYWADAGIKVNLVYLDGPTWVQRVYADLDFDLSYGCCGWVDPAALSEVSCKTFYPAGYNVSHYCNEEFDGLVDQATTEADVAKRQALFNQAEEMFVSDLGYMTMFWPLRYHAVSSQVCGYNNHQISEPWTEMYPDKWYLAQ
jgi:peptide/nickel transport system substrate-binding protein